MGNCESCGMSTENAKYCERCAPNGKLKSREEVREGWVEFLVSQGVDIDDAEKKVDEQMAMMPMWKK